MNRFKHTAAVLLALVLALPFSQAWAQNANDAFEKMPTNTLLFEVGGQVLTYTLDTRVSMVGNNSIYFCRKDSWGNYIDSVGFVLPGIPRVSNVIDTHRTDAVNYGAASLSYVNYTTGKARLYTASFYSEMSGGNTFDEFFNNATVHAAVQPSANAWLRITCEYMSADGACVGGYISGTLIDTTTGQTVSLSDGMYKYNLR